MAENSTAHSVLDSWEDAGDADTNVQLEQKHREVLEKQQLLKASEMAVEAASGASQVQPEKQALDSQQLKPPVFKILRRPQSTGHMRTDNRQYQKNQYPQNVTQIEENFPVDDQNLSRENSLTNDDQIQDTSTSASLTSGAVIFPKTLEFDDNLKKRKVPSHKTFEERHKAYLEARERIFGADYEGPLDDFQEDEMALQNLSLENNSTTAATNSSADDIQQFRIQSPPQMRIQSPPQMRIQLQPQMRIQLQPQMRIQVPPQFRQSRPQFISSNLSQNRRNPINENNAIPKLPYGCPPAQLLGRVSSSPSDFTKVARNQQGNRYS